MNTECEECDQQNLSLQRSPLDSKLRARNLEGVPSIVNEVLSSPGQPLDQETRAFMEPRFGHNFSHIRVHADTQAANSAAAVNALAYTVGKDVVFADGYYQPGSAQGRHLLAHELAHTIQQGSHNAIALQKLSVGPTDDSFERQADALADYVVSSSSIGPEKPPPQEHHSLQPTLQRQRCDKANDKIVTGPLAMQLPNITCDPTKETLANVRANPGVPPNILGITGSATGQLRIDYHELKGSLCEATVKEYPALSINPFMYTGEGTYDDGVEHVARGNGPCAGQRIRRKLMIIPAVAAKIREGEIEHCEDHKLAFALSQGKFNQAVRDLEGNYCPVTEVGHAPKCKEEFAQRFKDRTGIDFSDQDRISACLHNKTKLRDDPPNEWHSAKSDDSFYAPDCSSVTYIASTFWLQHIGRHPSSTIIKDCGEP